MTRDDDLLGYYGGDHPAADWLIVERRFDPERLPAMESVFAAGDRAPGRALP
jgi:hypothetical protein